MSERVCRWMKLLKRYNLALLQIGVKFGTSRRNVEISETPISGEVATLPHQIYLPEFLIFNLNIE